MSRTHPKNIITGVGWECRGKAGRNLTRYRTERCTGKLQLCAAVPTLQARDKNEKKCAQIKDINMEKRGRERGEGEWRAVRLQRWARARPFQLLGPRELVETST